MLVRPASPNVLCTLILYILLSHLGDEGVVAHVQPEDEGRRDDAPRGEVRARLGEGERDLARVQARGHADLRGRGDGQEG